MSIKSEMKNKVVQACSHYNKFDAISSEVYEIMSKYHPELIDSDEWMDSISSKICYGAYTDMKEFWKDLESILKGNHLEVGEG